MGLKEVIGTIMEEAEKQVKQLEEEAAAAVKKINTEADEEIKRYRGQREKEAEHVIEMARQKEEAAASFEGKKLLLDKKKEILSRVESEAGSRFLKLPQKEREKHLQMLFKKAAREIRASNVYVNKNDVIYLKSSGVNVLPGGQSGGLIAETDDGKVSVDYTFETQLRKTMQKNLRHVSGVLFDG